MSLNSQSVVRTLIREFTYCIHGHPQSSSLPVSSSTHTHTILYRVEYRDEDEDDDGLYVCVCVCVWILSLLIYLQSVGLSWGLLRGIQKERGEWILNRQLGSFAISLTHTSHNTKHKTCRHQVFCYIIISSREREKGHVRWT